MRKLDAFGSTLLPTTDEWPTIDQVQKFPLDKTMKLCKITYKKGYDVSNYPIDALQLCFTNQLKSPMLKTKNSKSSIEKSIDIDPSKTIAVVGFDVNQSP